MSTEDQPQPPPAAGSGGSTASSTAAQVGSAVASLAEAWLRDTVYGAVGLLSFITVLCGFAAADGPAYAAVGVVTGLAGFALPTAALVRQRPPSRIWLALLAGAVVAGAGLAVVLTG